MMHHRGRNRLPQKLHRLESSPLPSHQHLPLPSHHQQNHNPPLPSLYLIT